MPNTTLRDFVTAVFRANDLQVPYLGEGEAPVLSFLWSTLEVDARRPEGHPGKALSRRINQRLLTYATAEGLGLIELLVQQLKPLLSMPAVFQRSDDRYLLSVCLLYAFRLKPRVPLTVMENLLPVFDAASFIKTRDASEAFWECARITMFATLQTFLPEESDVRADENTDESLLERLARGLSQSAALADYFHWTPDIKDPMRLVLQFGYALLQMRYNREQKEEFKGKLEVCLKVGVFRALSQILSDRIFLQNFSANDQVLCVEVVCRLLIMFFDMEAKTLMRSTHLLHRSTVQSIENGSTEQSGDDYCSLMECLALVLERCPDVIVMPHAEHASEFLSWMPESQLLQRSVHVNPLSFLCSNLDGVRVQVMRTFLKVIRALATGEAGVERVFHQFVAGSRNQFSVPKEGYKYISWDFILGSFMNLCDALIKSSRMHRHGVSPEEFEGFAAYMHLLGKVFQEGAPALVTERIAQVDTEFRAILRNEKLMDIILFIFCKPVPPELKAGCCEALAGMARSPGIANTLLRNLKSTGLFAEQNDERRVNRYYLHNQLISIEAPMGEYSCTINTLRMVNASLHHADALPDKETAMLEVTQFCKDYLLDAVWRNLRFAKPDQFWELSAVAFEHFLICLERIDVDSFRSSSHRDLSPGQLVLHDILRQGQIYNAMHACAMRIYNERNTHSFASFSTNQTTLSLLELILATFDAERHIEYPPAGGYQSFNEVLMGAKEFTRAVLCTVDDSLPTAVQIAAVEVARQLFGSSAESMNALDPDVQVSLLRGLGAVYSQRFHF